ncbi:MAG: methyltransferase domain-containing protein [Solirubrobacteraceae bacterium]
MDLERLWASTYHPVNRVVWDTVGDLRGRDVLLVGNGTSQKELHFLSRAPRRLVFSDYSLEAVEAVRRLDVAGPIVFAAIDAMRLPFPDEGLDLVYGYAAVHHLADPAAFLREAARVLRPGGRAVFMDNRRSPVYQRAKLTVLAPLMRYYHRRGEVSPEDMRATLSGWHNEEELATMLAPLDVLPFFHRSLLVHYLATRASERLPPRRLWEVFRGSERMQLALVRLDERLGRFAPVRANQIRLVWGFHKPV